MPTLKLTERAVAALPASTKPMLYADSDLKGFAVRVMPSGSRSYVVNLYIRNGQHTESIGPCGSSLPLATARELARKAITDLHSGVDRKAARAAGKTIGEVHDHYLAHRKLAPRTRADYEKMVEEGPLARLKDTAIAKLTAQDVQRLHREAPGRTQANRALMYLRALTKHARRVMSLDLDPMLVTDAMHGAWHREAPRSGTIPPDSLGVWWKALDALRVDHRPSAAFLRLLLLLGLRPGELLSVKVEDVDLPRSLLKVTRTKTHTAQSLPLVALAQEELRVVIGRRKSGALFALDGPPRKALASANAAAGIEASAYDLRRTCATLLASIAPLHIVKSVLGHSASASRDITIKHYAMASIDEQRAALERLGALIQSKI